MRLLYLAWRHGGHDPYRLYNALDENYVPMDGGEPRPPRHPDRLRAVIYGFAETASIEEAKRG
jgi:hypothetical protein